MFKIINVFVCTRKKSIYSVNIICSAHTQILNKIFLNKNYIYLNYMKSFCLYQLKNYLQQNTLKFDYFN